MRKLLALVTTIALPVSAACTVHQTTAPSEIGPAEASLSLKLAANPDHIPQDGLHPAVLSITAFDAGGHPIAVQVHLTSSPAGFGTFSTDINGNVVTTTDANHPATVTFLPPAATTGVNTSVTVFASTIGPNAVNASTQQVSLVTQPAFAIAPSAPLPVMTITPFAQTYATTQALVFDATTSCGTGLVDGACPGTFAITKYLWNFGDNTATSTSTTVTHSYSAAGTYQIALTITNSQNVVASVTQTISVAVVAAPTAVFSFSPTPVVHNIATNFNAALSTAASGHTLARYDWNFGDGTTATSTANNLNHTFTAAGTYTVTLTVTDDVGQSKTTSSTVTVT
jgi:hypothetical protein